MTETTRLIVVIVLSHAIGIHTAATLMLIIKLLDKKGRKKKWK